MDWSHRAYLRKQKMLRGYTAALAMLSVSVALMPVVNDCKDITKIPLYLDGALFWISFISTIRMAIKINNSRRQSAAFNKKYKGIKKFALIHFFQNKKAAVADVVMFAALMTFVIGRFLKWNMIILFLCISMFVFSFGMHCMLNGINYIYIKHKTKVRRG